MSLRTYWQAISLLTKLWETLYCCIHDVVMGRMALNSVCTVAVIVGVTVVAGTPMLLVMEYADQDCLLSFLQDKRKGELSQADMLTFASEIAQVHVFASSNTHANLILSWEGHDIFFNNWLFNIQLKCMSKAQASRVKTLNWAIFYHSQGMLYLSSKGIVHRDLAARNVLVTAQTHMKISDFGLSRCLGSDRDYYKCGSDKDIPAPWWVCNKLLLPSCHVTVSNVLQRKYATLYVCKPFWHKIKTIWMKLWAFSILHRCAPEALLERKFSVKGDVWSYGITVWEIYSYGQEPSLCAIESLPHELHKGKRLPRPPDCPDSVYTKLLFGCWQFEADKRASFEDVVVTISMLQKGEFK